MIWHDIHIPCHIVVTYSHWFTLIIYNMWTWIGRDSHSCNAWAPPLRVLSCMLNGKFSFVSAWLAYMNGVHWLFCSSFYWRIVTILLWQTGVLFLPLEYGRFIFLRLCEQRQSLFHCSWCMNSSYSTVDISTSFRVCNQKWWLNNTYWLTHPLLTQ